MLSFFRLLEKLPAHFIRVLCSLFVFAAYKPTRSCSKWVWQWT